MTMSSNSEQAVEAAAAGEDRRGKKAGSAPHSRGVAPTAKPGRKGRRGRTAPKTANKARSGQPRVVREGSKTAAVLSLMQRPKGATLAEIMDATGWQAHSVRGFISGTLGRKMGLPVASARREDGQRVYSMPK